MKWLRFVLFFALLFSGFSFSKAQVFEQKQVLVWEWIENTPNQNALAYSGQEIKITNTDTVLAIMNWIKNEFPTLAFSGVDLSLKSLIKSPQGFHVAFVQTFYGIEVFGTEVKINFDNDFVITSLFQNVLNTSSWNFQKLPVAQKPNNQATKVICFYNEAVYCGWQYINHQNASKIIVISNEYFYAISLKSNFHQVKKDTTVWLQVFNPDPLTTATQQYNNDFANNKDADNEVINAERKWLKVLANFENDTFWCQNKYVKFGESPVSSVPFSLSDTFSFTRAEPGFEYAMILYHITNFKNYLNSLGFEKFMNYAIEVHPHALTSDDSYFSRQSEPPYKNRGQIYFGYCTDTCSSTSSNCTKNCCHVDDAEDADVIIHEYTHAISFYANQNENNKHNRKSIDEGLGDYFACAYSANLSSYNSENLFNWDGHNPFWEGRKCFSSRTTDDYAPRDIYANGEILVAALVEINQKIGRNITDIILLNSVYEYADNMKLQDAAMLFLKNEERLFSGKNANTICAIFKKYKLVDDDFCSSAMLPLQTMDLIDKAYFAEGGLFNLVFNNNVERASIKLIDAQGKTVFFENAFSGLQLSKTVQVNSGLYMLYIETKQGFALSKVVKI